MSLPATTSAFLVANIFARASGYIDKRNADIGDHVKEGQLLAEIIAPELDHQIAQAEATLAQMRRRYSKRRRIWTSRSVTWARDSPLVKQGWATQQQGTIDVQNIKAQEAAVAVAQANVVAEQAQIEVLISRRPISASSPRSMASSPSATSTWALSCKPTRRAAPSCSPSCRAT